MLIYVLPSFGACPNLSLKFATAQIEPSLNYQYVLLFFSA